MIIKHNELKLSKMILIKNLDMITNQFKNNNQIELVLLVFKCS